MRVEALPYYVEFIKKPLLLLLHIQGTLYINNQKKLKYHKTESKKTIFTVQMYRL